MGPGPFLVRHYLRVDTKDVAILRMEQSEQQAYGKTENENPADRQINFLDLSQLYARVCHRIHLLGFPHFSDLGYNFAASVQLHPFDLASYHGHRSLNQRRLLDQLIKRDLLKPDLHFRC